LTNGGGPGRRARDEPGQIGCFIWGLAHGIRDAFTGGKLPKRLDGTTFAYGVTVDGGLCYVFDNGIALYEGFGAQYIEGFEPYRAWGATVNMPIDSGSRTS
jgi:hypothetical protein